MSTPAPTPRPHGTLLSLAFRLGGHTVLYSVSAVVGFVMSVVTVAVLTRLLPLASYGQLALLFFFASLLTVVYNAGTLQGTFGRVFGASGEEDAGGIDDLEDHVAANKRRALGSALLLTIAVAGFGTLAISVFADDIARLDIGLPTDSSALRWAAVCGATGAIWRLLLNVTRYERRPRLFLALSILRPLVVVGLTIWLVSVDATVSRALAGTALGNVVVSIIALAISRRSYLIAFDREDVAAILKRGAFFIPVIVAFWVIQSVDLYLVAIFTSDADVARYRVASRIASGVSYFVSAFMMAWMPLSRTSLYEAVSRERGLTEATARILTYFMVACLWLLLSMTVFADALIAIAPTYYASAAPLIPLVAAGFIAFGFFIVFFRGSKLPARRRLYQRLAVGAALVFLPLGAVLALVAGPYGPPLAQLIAFSLAAGWLVVASKRGGHPLPVHAGAVTRVSVLAAALVLVSLLLTPELGWARPLFDIVLWVLFPIGAVALGAIARDDLRRIPALLGRRRRRTELGEVFDRLEALPDDEHELLELLVRRGVPPAEAAEMVGVDESEALNRAAAAVRAVADRPGASLDDAGLARYLFSREAVAERDARARALWRAGVEPAELDVLDTTLQRLRRAPAERWRRPVGSTH